jgi:hypothetical protein
MSSESDSSKESQPIEQPAEKPEPATQPAKKPEPLKKPGIEIKQEYTHASV